MWPQWFPSNANGTNVAYAWDADNRLSSVTDSRISGATNYTYDQTSQLSTLQYPIGVRSLTTIATDQSASTSPVRWVFR